jgi:energy-coupling factor transporter ATP-binding protein EcfA2
MRGEAGEIVGRRAFEDDDHVGLRETRGDHRSTATDFFLHRRDGEEIAGRGGGVELVGRKRERGHADAVVESLGGIKSGLREGRERAFRHDRVARADAETRDMASFVRAAMMGEGVESGSVKIDGHDVRGLTGESLRAAIGVVPQDPHMFHDSVRANLLYARPDATDDAMIEACRAARIHDVIAALPDGYDTVVGDRGYRLSGGEKQRLAIARLLLKNPAVIILDEATSHLDYENEALVQEALADAMRNRTALVIAHRLSTVRDADRIVVVEDGRIAEIGTHDELIAGNGTYAALIRSGDEIRVDS